MNRNRLICNMALYSVYGMHVTSFFPNIYDFFSSDTFAIFTSFSLHTLSYLIISFVQQISAIMIRLLLFETFNFCACRVRVFHHRLRHHQCLHSMLFEFKSLPLYTCMWHCSIHTSSSCFFSILNFLTSYEYAYNRTFILYGV